MSKRKKKDGTKYALRLDLAVTAMLQEPSIRAAAVKIGVGYATLRRWLRTPSFQEAYKKAQREALDHAVAKLQAYSSEAVETLVQVMRDPESPGSTRSSAAKSLLELVSKFMENGEMLSKMENLEKLLMEQAKQK